MTSLLFSEPQWPLAANAFLRPLRVADAEVVFGTVTSNREWLRTWLPWVDHTHSALDSRFFIEDAHLRQQRGERFVLGIWVGEELAGCVGLNEVVAEHRRATLGYWLAAKFCGQGLMTQAVQMLTEYALGELDLYRLEIVCAVDNYASRAVAERCGYAQEGTLAAYLWQHGQPVDVALYVKIVKQ